jgi:hypothetical protein
MSASSSPSSRPSSVVRIPVRGEELIIAVHRLTYLGGRDNFASPGGVFVSPEGEVGVFLDASVPDHEVEGALRRELKANMKVLEAAVFEQRKIRLKAARTQMD